MDSEEQSSISQREGIVLLSLELHLGLKSLVGIFWSRIIL